MESAANIIPSADEMDVFFHSMSDATGNAVNAASYYASPAARAAAAAVHGYHRPSHGESSLCLLHLPLLFLARCLICKLKTPILAVRDLQNVETFDGLPFAVCRLPFAICRFYQIVC